MDDGDSEDGSSRPFPAPWLLAPCLLAGVNTLRVSATRVNTLRLSAAGRAGMVVSARVAAVPVLPSASMPAALALPAAVVPARDPAELALPAVDLTSGLVLPTSSAGKGTLSLTGEEAGGEAVDDADE